MQQESVYIFLQFLTTGLANGSVYALVALGFVLIYKSTKVLNFAQGELLMVGAYIFFAVSIKFQLGFLATLLIALSFSFLLGILIEVVILRRFIGEPIFSVIMVTVGLASVLRSLVGLIWGHEEKRLDLFFSDKVFSFFDLKIFQSHVFTILTSLILFIIFLLFFKHSKIGLAMRSTAENQDVSLLMGISVKLVFAISWAIAAMVATLGGLFWGNLGFLHTNMSHIGLKAFSVAILGGLDSVGGALIGGLIIGIIESLVGGYIEAGIGELAAYVALFLILILRPYGIFGSEEIERV